MEDELVEQTPRWKVTDGKPDETFIKLTLFTKDLQTKSSLGKLKLVRKVTNADVNVQFTDRSLSMTAIVTPAKKSAKKIKYHYAKELKYDIIKDECYHEVSDNKVKLYLKKKDAERWNVEEAEWNPTLGY